MNNLALQDALTAASKGWRIFPVTIDKEGNSWKKPSVMAWQLVSTTNPDQIRKWWSTLKEIKGYGWHTAGHVAIDFDVIGGEESLNKAGYETPTTLTTISGNKEKKGRYTIIYRLPPGKRLKVTKLSSFSGFKNFNGIDIRSSGGQIVGPGSYHITGGTYTDNGVDPVTAPSWLISLAEDEKEHYTREWTDAEARAQRHAQERRERAADDAIVDDYDSFLDEFYPIIPSTRHDMVLRAILALYRKHLPKDSIIKLLTDWLLRFQHNYDTEPSRAIELMRRTVDNTDDKIAEGLLKIVDHDRDTASLELSDFYSSLYMKIITGVDVQEGIGEHDIDKRDDKPDMLGLSSRCSRSKNGGFDQDEETPREIKIPTRKKKFTDMDKQFILMILKHIQYCREVKKEKEIKWTIHQIIRTFKLLTGLEIGNVSTLYRYINKYISRIKNDEIIEASYIELLVTSHSSDKRGVPSSYIVPSFLTERGRS